MQTLAQFLKNPVALIGLVLLVLVAAMALSAGGKYACVMMLMVARPARHAEMSASASD